LTSDPIKAAHSEPQVFLCLDKIENKKNEKREFEKNEIAGLLNYKQCENRQKIKRKEERSAEPLDDRPVFWFSARPVHMSGLQSKNLRRISS
jgi:hypothetical protein